MIVKETFLNKLREAFNLNIYEVKIWTAILSRGISTAGELSDISEVPRSRSYDILESLEKKGFVIMKLGKPIKYIAVNPEDIIKRVKKLYRENMEKKLERLENLKKTELYNELELLHKQGIDFIEPSDLSGALRGRENIYNHLNTMLSNAQKSVVIVTTPDGLVRKSEVLKRSLKKLSEKNIKTRIVVPINKECSDAVNELSKFAEIRNTQSINARFAIIDSKEVLFMVLNDKETHPSYDVGIWVTTPYFASAFQSLFDIVWNKLQPANKLITK